MPFSAIDSDLVCYGSPTSAASEASMGMDQLAIRVSVFIYLQYPFPLVSQKRISR
jgi:hypothetical protein